MRRWKWFQRRDEPVDMVGPATSYARRRGASAPGCAPTERPAWDAVTLMISDTPLITMGMRQLYGIRQRPMDPS
ncbi:hypothetical protein SAMN05444365_101878 [Micromonospora pattaloongensis]|uniref:Uncharacterized protein n=1 Tax=Micromonospora pattaloongensis TaxID=405436 RepID=A0A1H3HMW4_9ACTN|nr:hypothetical protein SAMN05444365_101878 [Micromonospora pattaloongensis]